MECADLLSFASESSRVPFFTGLPFFCFVVEILAFLNLGSRLIKSAAEVKFEDPFKLEPFTVPEGAEIKSPTNVPFLFFFFFFFWETELDSPLLLSETRLDF